MRKLVNKKAQAAIELAVFGSILIFILGTIVRTAVSSSYNQSQNFKAMRLAMLESYQSSQNQSTSHNSASVMFIEDRLSPDSGKYGDLERDPYLANGTGTFSYMLDYPVDVGQDVVNNLPIMDVWVNGMQFPLTTASYVYYKTLAQSPIPPPLPGLGEGPFPFTNPPGPNWMAECQQNQLLRQNREWIGDGGSRFKASDFDVINVNVSGLDIFNELDREGYIQVNSTPSGASPTPRAYTDVIYWHDLARWLGQYGGDISAELDSIKNILTNSKVLVSGTTYKLFYTQAVNGTTQFVQEPPDCNNALTSKDHALCLQLILGGVKNQADGITALADGDLMFDLQRLGLSNAQIESQDQFPPETSPTTTHLRKHIAWQWAATPAINASNIGLDTTKNEYPSYDIDGRLRTVSIYTFTRGDTGAPVVSYEDFSGGDIDEQWDPTTCTPQPGLQNDTQVLTYTSDIPSPNAPLGPTYLQIKEGKLFNPETNQFVRSINKRDTVDVISRVFKFSNNTGRFCTLSCPDGSPCPDSKSRTPGQCGDGGPKCTSNNSSSHVCGTDPSDQYCALPNNVEVCSAGTYADNCGSSTNLSKTCYDTNNNTLYIRSRLNDQGGHFWFTDSAGALRVKS